MAKKKVKQPKLGKKALSNLPLQDLKSLLPGGKLTNGSNECEDLYDSNEVVQAQPQGVCLMEAVAWVTGEEHSDHPECACPALTEFAIQINDGVSDRVRQELLPAIPALVGSKTNSSKVRLKRVKRLLDALLDAIIPSLLKNINEEYDIITAVLVRELNQHVMVSGSAINKRHLTRTVKLLDAILTSDEDESITEIRNLAETLLREWDNTGLSFFDYESMLDFNPADMVGIAHSLLPGILQYVAEA